ncbi:L-fuco-beta-pyranose dehydrogenase [Leucobacter sp. 7(1)]|uniref:SDR family NAD(P)-dependent oxidoreductase n=1 Tax=Leucobacter sp. 7(1) TaxID=1255613 RepID=UPI00097F0257|nr:SDR family NAD(P)-dependent oxidoreductase [Leucobacter sp. 7(1)]SJN11568.1 L-fuco-beta-pyranose dehydrogenase [Leucobacter sp. 7(1)]
MTETPSGPELAPGSIDPADLAIALRVLEAAGDLPSDHPDVVSVRRATSGMYKAAKRVRRRSTRNEISSANRAVIAATATGAADRIDDETRGLPLTTSATAPIAGELRKAQNCYICKQPYTQVDAFYHQLCPSCAESSHAKRNARTDLTGKRALLTGGRAKIGMHIALRLLRDGADLTITTRFPRDAARRFASLPDSADWLDRLHVVGIDLRDPSQVVALADSVAAGGPLDILINNAAQTVRRSPGSYSLLADAESQPLPAGSFPDTMTLGSPAELHPRALQSSVGADGTVALDPLDASALAGTVAAGFAHTLTGADLSALAMAPGSSSLEKHADGSAIDAGGLVPDVAHVNSWVQHVQEVDPLEMLEVQLCNATAPFILISRLRASMAASPARRTYVVNVSAMEGQFSRRYKGPGHPHTNMAKAALNMLTRTSAGEMFETDKILMTAVDTGWITDERPHFTKVRLAEEGFHAPLDLVDGAARVYDPIVRGEEEQEDLYGCFLKDYAPHPW